MQDKTTGRFIGSKYVKIDGVWYKGKCFDCGELITSHKAKKCRNCFWREKRNPVIINGGSVKHYHKAHYWISKIMGKPMNCSNCGFTSQNSRQFHWANVSEEYKLELSDWLRLCASCHKKYDWNRHKW